MAFEKVNSTQASNERQLYAVDLARWSRDHTGLKELRDLREVQTLSTVLAKISMRSRGVISLSSRWTTGFFL